MNPAYLESTELSDTGRVRKNNEDACLRLPEWGVYCVADGMGGNAAGDIASEAITTNLHEVFNESQPKAGETLADRVAQFRKAINQASKWISRFAEEKVIGQVGSTVVGLVFDPLTPRQAVALHAGDSRLYRYRADRLEQLTKDHSAANAIAAKLGCTPESLPAKYHNELTRAVGLKETAELELTHVDVQSGDVFFACSDGLSRMLADDRISQLLKSGAASPLADVAQALISAANEAGGKDNVTVVLVKVGDITNAPKAIALVEEEEPPTATTPVAPPATPEPKTDTQPTTTRPTPDSRATIEVNTPETDPPDNRPGQIKIAIIVVAALLIGGIGIYLVKRRGAGNSPTAATPPSDSRPPVAGTPPPPPARPATGSLILGSEPPGAEVFLRGERRGSTPFEAQGAAGEILAYTLGSLTHTGSVTATILAGETQTTNVTLAWRQGTLLIKSDPPGATVRVAEHPDSTTPVELKLKAGPQTLTLKYPGLDEITLTATIPGEKQTTTNVVIPYGALIVQSKPKGARVTFDGKFAGFTPFTNAVLRPKPVVIQASLNNYLPTNLNFSITPGRTQVLDLALQRESGMLALKSNFPGAIGFIDGKPVGSLPARVPVETGIEHLVTVEYQGQTRTSSAITVTANATRELAFVFVEAPAKPSVPKPIVVENRNWTNDLGMGFARESSQNVWYGTARVTPAQYERITGTPLAEDFKGEDAGLPCVVNLPLEEVNNFITKLNARLQGGGKLPPGSETLHYALPGTDQWQLMGSKAKALGIQVESFSRFAEWCLQGNEPKNASYAGIFRRGKFETTPRSSPKGMAFRLVLAP
jgi:serine/threonine protein phosphatase PrpC